jgi:hypothetical protein
MSINLTDLQTYHFGAYRRTNLPIWWSILQCCIPFYRRTNLPIWWSILQCCIQSQAQEVCIPLKTACFWTGTYGRQEPCIYTLYMTKNHVYDQEPCIYTLYMTKHLVISLPRIPYLHRIYMVNPTFIPAKSAAYIHHVYLQVCGSGQPYALDQGE